MKIVFFSGGGNSLSVVTMFPLSCFAGGDIFIHAKSNDRSKLFELAQRVISQLPNNSIERCEDIYGWVYRNGRDLSGFIDGKWCVPCLSEATFVSSRRTLCSLAPCAGNISCFTNTQRLTKFCGFPSPKQNNLVFETKQNRA